MENGGRAAYSIQIRWKPGDFITTMPSPTSSTGASPLVSPTNVGPEATSAVPSSSSSPQSGSQSSGRLSTGAIAAIAVVAGIVAVAALATLVWCKRRSSIRHGNSGGQSGKADYGSAEGATPYHAAGTFGFKQEMEGSRVTSEPSGTPKAILLESNPPRSELP
jgi:hypothetical protein